MKKSILNLRGAQELSKNEQKSVFGGAELTIYDKFDFCLNATEIVPTGCPCGPRSQCAITYTVGLGPNSHEGVCRGGVCS